MRQVRLGGIFKSGSFTPWLFVVFLAVWVISLFYSPWGSFDFTTELASELGVSDFVLKQGLLLLAPAIASGLDTLTYFYEHMVIEQGSFADRLVMMTTMVWSLIGYAIMFRLLEKVHARIHGDSERWYTVCLDMVAIEYIATYAFNLALYALMVAMANLTGEALGDWGWIGLPLIILTILGLWSLLYIVGFVFVYLIAGAVISLAVPYFSRWLLLVKLGVWGLISDVIFFGLLVVFAGIVWRLVSGRVYEFIEGVFSVHTPWYLEPLEEFLAL